MQITRVGRKQSRDAATGLGGADALAADLPPDYGHFKDEAKQSPHDAGDSLLAPSSHRDMTDDVFSLVAHIRCISTEDARRFVFSQDDSLAST